MEEEKSKAEDLFDHTKEYVKTISDIAVLTVIDKATDIISELALDFILAVIFILFLLFGSFCLAYCCSEYMGKGIYFGFLLVTTGYFLIGIVFWIMRKAWIKEPMSDFLIKKVFKPKNDDK